MNGHHAGCECHFTTACNLTGYRECLGCGLGHKLCNCPCGGRRPCHGCMDCRGRQICQRRLRRPARSLLLEINAVLKPLGTLGRA